MAYRNGTYIAFHANGEKEPTASDIKYYNLLKAWNVRQEQYFEFVNSHEKTNAVRDSSKKGTLERALKTRLQNSKNMILIIGETTHEDTDWIPFEVRYAVDECTIPIIAAYTGYKCITDPKALSDLWPAALKKRIEDGTALVIHVPFKQDPLADAVVQFHIGNRPSTGLVCYSREAYQTWGLI